MTEMPEGRHHKVVDLASTLTIAELSRAIRRGQVSIIDAVDATLARIAALDAPIKAWVSVDPERARNEARTLDAEARAGKIRGPLHGVPVGIKDIFHVAGMVTTAGAEAFAHERPEHDSEAVSRLRGSGAIVIGKTQTTQFAYADPTITRNPWNLDHTPGGSSSGSAAAVAARMVPLALGTQTIGSVLRPASYCGVVGFKPTHGRISFRGIVPAAPSLDHVGVFCRSVTDASMALQVLAGYDSTDPFSLDVPAEEYSSAFIDEPAPPRLGVPRQYFLQESAPEMAGHVQAVVREFEARGAEVEEVDLPPAFEGIHHAGLRVLEAEAAAYHAERFRMHRGQYGPRIRALVEAGLALLAVEYVRAQQHRRRFQQEIDSVLSRYDALVVPVAPSHAPRGLESTGDPKFCAPWTFAGVPTIALPSGISSGGLPMAIQLVSARLQEARLLRTAAWCEKVLEFSAAPANL